MNHLQYENGMTPDDILSYCLSDLKDVVLAESWGERAGGETKSFPMLMLSAQWSDIYNMGPLMIRYVPSKVYVLSRPAKAGGSP